MQISSVLVCLVGAIMMVSAQPFPGPVGPGPVVPGPVGPVVPGLLPPILPPIIPPIFPPFLFGGLRFRPFFGLRRLALLGGLGMPFGPFGFPFIGKRDTEHMNTVEVEKVEKIEESLQKVVEKSVAEAEPAIAKAVNEIVQKSVEAAINAAADKVIMEKSVETLGVRSVCSLSTAEGKFSCKGVEKHTFECTVRPEITRLGEFKTSLMDLELRRPSETEKTVFDLVGRKSQITTVNPVDKTDVVISIFRGEHEKMTGFMIEDEKCWTHIESMVEAMKPEEIAVNLVIA